MYRISDQVQAKVIAAVEALDITTEERGQTGWEINPALLSAGPGMMPQLGFVIGISVPVPGTEDDHILHMEPVLNPHASQEEVSALVAKLHTGAYAEAREKRVRIAVAANGEKRTEGGLVLPD
jgi:hypothetical protein